jgi:hypothetical protein
MDPDAYRSYVIRVRRRSTGDPGGDRGATRLDVEDLIGGAKTSVSGIPAEALADQLERLTDGAHRADADRADADRADRAASAPPARTEGA